MNQIYHQCAFSQRNASMSYQVTVQPSGHEFSVVGNDSLLEAALRAGIPLNYSCSNGNCGDCKARLTSGQLTKLHPHDYALKDAEKANGTFLLCSCAPASDVIIEAAVAGADDIPQQTIMAKVKSVETLSRSVAALHLTLPRSQRLRFLAGQHVTLSADGTEGEFYIASCPCEDRHVEVHVQRDESDFATRVFESLRKEDAIHLTGPHGQFVMKLDSRRPVLFIAWNDTFAPIKSLIQHALSLEIAEAMYLYWVAGDDGHYQDNLGRAWADALDDFVYQPLSSAADPAAIAESILAQHPSLVRADIYAAGPAAFLDALKTGALARGLSPLGWHEEIIV
jgi:CDP-4-dehydro-6-deoxyglucose reductase, E3